MKTYFILIFVSLQPHMDGPVGWEKDPTIYFDQDTGKFMRLVDGDAGSELLMEWDVSRETWKFVPIPDPDPDPKTMKKRPNEDDDSSQIDQIPRNNNTDNNTDNTKAGKRKKKNKSATSRKNTSIFVSNLPEDVTVTELSQYFSRCGIILEDLQAAVAAKYASMAGKVSNYEFVPKIKLYHGEDGKFKGEALIVFYKEESVALAVDLFDDSEFRPNHRISVQEAKFGVASKSDAIGEENTFGQQQPPQNRKEASNRQLSREEKQLLRSRFQNMERKLDWMEAEDRMAEKKLEKLSKTVILKHMFRLEDLNRDIGLLAEIKQDLLDECEKLGTVTKVDVYDQSEDGVCLVRFMDVESAVACVAIMNGRYFDGLLVEAQQAHLMDPVALASLKRKKSSNKTHVGNDIGNNGDEDDDDDDEEQRLDDFGKWLESQ